MDDRVSDVVLERSSATMFENDPKTVENILFLEVRRKRAKGTALPQPSAKMNMQVARKLPCDPVRRRKHSGARCDPIPLNQFSLFL